VSGAARLAAEEPDRTGLPRHPLSAERKAEAQMTGDERQLTAQEKEQILAKDHHTFDLCQREWQELLDLLSGLEDSKRGDVQTEIHNLIRWALYHDKQWGRQQSAGEVRKQLKRIHDSASRLLAVATELGLATHEELGQALGERRNLEVPGNGRKQRQERSTETLFLLGSLGQPALARVVPDLRAIRNSASIALERIDLGEPPRLPTRGPQHSGAAKLLTDLLADLWERIMRKPATYGGPFEFFACMVLQKADLDWSRRTVREVLQHRKSRSVNE